MVSSARRRQELPDLEVDSIRTFVRRTAPAQLEATERRPGTGKSPQRVPSASTVQMLGHPRLGQLERSLSDPGMRSSTWPGERRSAAPTPKQQSPPLRLSLPLRRSSISSLTFPGETVAMFRCFIHAFNVCHDDLFVYLL